MGKTKIHNDTIQFRVEQDFVDMTPSTEPDPDWRQRDKNGHLHLWRLINGKPDFLPSLKHVEDAPATEDHPGVSHYECRQCGEHVEPGYRSVNIRREMAGLRHYYINEQEVSEEEYNRVFAEVKKRCG